MVHPQNQKTRKERKTTNKKNPTRFTHTHIPLLYFASATDKVALLIGNQDYRSAQQLKAPEEDVGRLSNVLFKDCGFKTVTLLNLTQEEMLFATKAFCELLNRGVYGMYGGGVWIYERIRLWGCVGDV